VPRRRGVWVGTADRGGRPPRDGAGQGPPATSAEPPTTASPEHSWTRQNPLAGQQYGVDPVALARRFPWEVFALVALGPGGLVLPFPLWLIGAVAALTSKAAWSRGDRLIGLGGPPLVTVVGIALIGALNKNPSITVDVHAYVAAAHADGGLLFRIGAAVGACYLGVRLVRAYRAATAKGRSASGQP
jgi:hypothetical protein